MSLRLYAIAAGLLLLLATAAYAMFERGQRIAAVATAEHLALALEQTTDALQAERDAARRANKLAEDRAAEAAAARARAAAIEATARTLIDEFRAAEAEPDPQPVTETEPSNAPRATCSCAFSDADRRRVLEDIPVRRPAARPDPGPGLGGVDAVP